MTVLVGVCLVNSPDWLLTRNSFFSVAISVNLKESKNKQYPEFAPLIWQLKLLELSFKLLFNTEIWDFEIDLFLFINFEAQLSQFNREIGKGLHQFDFSPARAKNIQSTKSTYVNDREGKTGEEKKRILPARRNNLQFLRVKLII